MTSIGETLRRERVRRKLELDRISKELKISIKLLEAMETDRFDKLPGGVFTKSFVRQYARVLGLDDQEIAASLQRMLEPPAVPLEVPEPKPRAVGNVVLPRVKNVKNWMSAGDSRFRWSSSLSSLALVVVVVLVCSVVYSWSQRGQHAPAVPGRAPVMAQTAKALPPAPVAPATAEPAAATPAPVAATPEAGSAERLAAPVRVQLTAQQPVWVQATTDGKFAFSETLQPNGSRLIEASDRVYLKLGNAGGVRVEWNGKPVGPLGGEGQVLRVQFTSGGFQIVPAEAPTPDDDGPSEPGDSPSEPLAPL